MIYLDTHVVTDLGRSRDVQKLDKEARRLLNADNDRRVSPIIRLELEILFEIGRIKVPPDEILEALAEDLDLRVCGRPFADIARAAASERWTRDPFDRIIVAQARIAKAPLITRDTTIQSHYGKAIG